MTTVSTTKTAPVIGLDIIRFCAALMVMWFHLAYWSWAGMDGTASLVGGGVAKLEELRAYSNWGWVGVEIFFVLSGYVIAFSAESKSAFSFVKSRFVRLYPAVWVCAPISLLAIMIVGATTGTGYPLSELPQRIVRSLVLWPKGPWIDGVYWTLGIEISFYAVVAVLLLFRRFEKMPVMLTGIGLFCFIATTLHLKMDRNAELALLRHGSFFAIGGFMYLSSRRPLNSVERGLIAVFSLASIAEIHNKALEFGVSSTPPITIWIAAVIAIAAAAHRNNQMIKCLPTSAPRICRLMGLATYPLYLIHTVVGAAAMRLFVVAGISPGLSLTLALCLVIFMGFLVAIVLEPLVRTLVTRVITRRARGSVAYGQ